MELKTDKIHRILDTPYDELSPQDFGLAQCQLDALVECVGRHQIDAFQHIENKLVCERDAARAERDAAQAAELNALRQLGMAMERAERAEQRAVEEREHQIDDRAISLLREQHEKDLVDRTSKPTFYAYPAPGSAGRNVGNASEFANLVAEEIAAAREAMDKRDAEHGYGRAPGTPPARVSGLGVPETCSMPTPDGQCTARPTGRNNGFPFCSRHLDDAIRDGMRREHERTAIACPGCGGIGKQNIEHDCAATRDAIRGAVSGPKPASTLERERFMASSIDGGQTWWCPHCQASIIPDVPHVCTAVTCRRCGSSVLDGKDHGVGACPGDGNP